MHSVRMDLDPALRLHRLSHHAQVVHLEDVVVVSHGPRLQRLMLSPEIGGRLPGILQQPVTEEDFVAALDIGDRGSRLFHYMVTKGLLVADGVDEHEALRRTLLLDLGSSSMRGQGENYITPAVISVDDLPGDDRGQAPMASLRVDLVGGCVLDFLKDELLREGLRHGYVVESQLVHPDAPDRVARAVERSGSDLVVLMLGTSGTLGPLWDEAPFVGPEERKIRTTLVKERVAMLLDAIGAVADGRLVVVHNFAPPQVAPFGRVDYRMPPSIRDVVYDLNSWLDGELSGRRNFLLLDEERLVVRHGAETLFDDHLYPTSHHGGLPDVTDERPNQVRRISCVLSNEYIALYRLWTGAGKVKCVVCDLDGTLWPGQAAEHGFGWAASDATSAWLYRGIHQALRIVRQRGIVLATCSKNDEKSTLDQWRQVQDSYLLTPDDFVLHRINWRPKSQNIREIAAALGVSLESILFLDDSPVERAEVAGALPGVRVIAPVASTLRMQLLTDPTLEVLHQTDESANRTIMLKAQLERDIAESSATDHRSFLQSLAIRMTLERLRTSDVLPRVHELLQRTTQYNTALIRPDEAALHRIITRSDADVYVLRVVDRFVNYGLVGVCICSGTEIDTVVLSCRVIGLSIAEPFLTSIIRRRWAPDTAIYSRLVQGPRNHPCRTLFEDCGFDPLHDGRHVLSNWAQLPLVDGEVYSVTWQNEET